MALLTSQSSLYSSSSSSRQAPKRATRSKHLLEEYEVIFGPKKSSSPSSPSYNSSSSVSRRRSSRVSAKLPARSVGYFAVPPDRKSNAHRHDAQSHTNKPHRYMTRGASASSLSAGRSSGGPSSEDIASDRSSHDHSPHDRTDRAYPHFPRRTVSNYKNYHSSPSVNNQHTHNITNNNNNNNIINHNHNHNHLHLTIPIPTQQFPHDRPPSPFLSPSATPPPPSPLSVPVIAVEPFSESEFEPEYESESKGTVAVCGQETCSIEGDRFVVGDTVARLPCGHVFHRDCIIPFIMSKMDGGYCPLDGTIVSREEAPLLPVWIVKHTEDTSTSSAGTSPALKPKDMSIVASNSSKSHSKIRTQSSLQRDIPSFSLLPRESETVMKEWTPAPKESCLVCGAKFKHGEMATRIKSCGHVFHSTCFEAYISRENKPRCPYDGEKIMQRDLRTVVVATNQRSSNSRDGSRQSHKYLEPRAREPKIRRALRAHTKIADQSQDHCATEKALTEIIGPGGRLECVMRRATSVMRRHASLGENGDPVRTVARPDSCCIDGQKIRVDEAAVAFEECGHIMHARCAERGGSCRCKSKGGSRERRKGRCGELLSVVADAEERRWRCAELVVLARERAVAYTMEQHGDPEAALDLVTAATAEMKASLKTRKQHVNEARKKTHRKESTTNNIHDEVYGNSNINARQKSLPEGFNPLMRAFSETKGNNNNNSRSRSRSRPKYTAPTAVVAVDERKADINVYGSANGYGYHDHNSKHGNNTSITRRSSLPFGNSIGLIRRSDEMKNNSSKRSRLVNEGRCAVDGKHFTRDEIVVKLPCGHIVHQHCIDPQWERGHDFICPSDGKPVPPSAQNHLEAWLYEG